MSKRRAELEVSAGGIVFRRIPGEAPRYLLIRDSYNNWGFPKGHLEGDESPAEAALRETAEETGLQQLSLQGPIRVIDWHFRFRGRHIHKYCHFFLFESPEGEVCPQVDEGITACQWRPLPEALEILSYDNARGVLKRAGEMVRTLVAVGAGRAGGRADRRTDGESDGRTDGQSDGRTVGQSPVPKAPHQQPDLDRTRSGPTSTRPPPPVRPSARPPDMPAIAALLESRAALTSLRRSLPKGGPRVVTCRSSSALQPPDGKAVDRRGGPGTATPPPARAVSAGELDFLWFPWSPTRRFALTTGSCSWPAAMRLPPLPWRAWTIP